jgi:hypothetical protein
MASRKSPRTGKRLTRANEGLSAKQYRAKRLAKQRVARMAVVQPGGKFVNVMVRGRDIEKLQLRNEAMSKAASGDDTLLKRFKRRFKRYSVNDISKTSRVDLIMSRDELDRSRQRMTKAARHALDKRYAEEMADAA